MLKENHIPHVQGCLENEKTIHRIEAYLSGELDYTPTTDYSLEMEKRVQSLELKVPAYEGHAEIIAEEAADMTGAYNDLNRQIHSIQIDIKDIKQALHIIITTLKKITK